MRFQLRILLPVLTALALLAGTPPRTHAAIPAVPNLGAEADTTIPLLRWDLLAKTVYDPRYPIDWPEEILAYDEQLVRMEGYLMLRYDSQDPADLFLTGINPMQLFCGPTDMTLVAEMYLPGFRLDDWESLPVEITGVFHLSGTTHDMRPIYLLHGRSWRPLKRWVQDFPGAYPPETREQEDASDR